jgi:hypothetical protein
VTTAVHTKTTWTITATSGLAVTGYLPPWAQEDPSEAGVPVGRLGKVLADICHWAEFPELRAQADHLDHQVRPALTAARADWAASGRRYAG